MITVQVLGGGVAGQCLLFGFFGDTAATVAFYALVLVDRSPSSPLRATRPVPWGSTGTTSSRGGPGVEREEAKVKAEGNRTKAGTFTTPVLGPLAVAFGIVAASIAVAFELAFPTNG